MLCNFQLITTHRSIRRGGGNGVIPTPELAVEGVLPYPELLMFNKLLQCHYIFSLTFHSGRSKTPLGGGGGVGGGGAFL